MKVDTPVFTGPLDLLLSLIEKKQIDICEVSISEIADDYLEQVSAMEWPDIDQVAEFLVISATLLYIKVRALLPPDELGEEPEEELEEIDDPRAELVARLIEYRKFRDAARALRPHEEIGSRMFTRPYMPLPKSVKRSSPLVGVTARDLARLYLEAVTSLPEEFTQAPSDEIPIASQMVAVLSRLARRDRLGFFEFLEGAKGRSVLIATLLAVLELVRRGRIGATQPTAFGEIWMFPRSQGRERSQGQAAEQNQSAKQDYRLDAEYHDNLGGDVQ